MKSARLVLTIPLATESGHCFIGCPLWGHVAGWEYEKKRNVLGMRVYSGCKLHYDTPSGRPGVKCPLRREKK